MWILDRVSYTVFMKVNGKYSMEVLYFRKLNLEWFLKRCWVLYSNHYRTKMLLEIIRMNLIQSEIIWMMNGRKTPIHVHDI